MTAAPGVIDAVLAHARRARPAECCGVLIGTSDAIASAVPARNLAEEPTRRFLIDPADHVAAQRAARAAGLEICGFYHSHPRGSAEPSATDLAEATYDGLLYVIVGLGAEPPDVRAYLVHDGRWVPQRVRGA